MTFWQHMCGCSASLAAELTWIGFFTVLCHEHLSIIIFPTLILKYSTTLWGEISLHSSSISCTHSKLHNVVVTTLTQ